MPTCAVAGEVYHFGIGLYQTADTKLLQVNPTIAVGDFKVSINGGALTDMVNTPVVVPALGMRVEMVLSAAETTAAGAGGHICIFWHDVLGGQWCDGSALVFVHAGEVAWEVWEEILTGATHNTATSAGRRLRQIASTLVYDGTVVSSTTNSVVLDAAASVTTNIYRGNVIVIMSGAGAGQARTIVEYIGGATKRCMLDRPWVTNPALGDELILIAGQTELVMSFGTVVSATAGTIRLAATESIVPNIYRYSVIVVTSSTGADSEARLITSYDGPTQTVSVAPNWTVTPNAGDVYKIIPVGRAVTESITADAISASSLATDAVTEIATAVALADAIAIWTAATRTLTVPAVTLPTSSGTDIVLYKYANNSVTISSLTISAARTALYLTIKSTADDDDDESLVQVKETVGLTYLDGAVAATPAWGSLTPSVGLDSVTFVLLDHAAELLDPGSYCWDLKQILAAGAAIPLAEGTCTVRRVVTRAEV